MINFFELVMITIGILLIFVYPKIIRLSIILFIGYLTIWYSWYFVILFIPLLLIMFYFKNKREKKKDGQI